jgi:hypothetical protein
MGFIQLLHVWFAEWQGNVTEKDAPEKAEEKRRHLVDCLAYILLDEPYFAEPSRGTARAVDSMQRETGWALEADLSFRLRRIIAAK